MILTVTANPAVDRVYKLDSFALGKVHRPESVTMSAGGKGINVARVAKILGFDVCAMGFVGGSAGSFIEDEVNKLGIKSNFTKVSGETRTNVNITDLSGKSGEILDKGPVITEEERQCFETEFANAIKDCSIVVASGSLPEGLDSSFYCDIVKTAHKAGKRIICDTSAKALSDVIKERPFMVKPNNDELMQLFGTKPETDAELKKCLDELHNMGVCVPFVTLGADGAAALVDGVFLKFTPPKIKAVNTVGSGDSTVAGIAVGLDRAFSVVDSIKLGMACGAANTQFEQTGLVSRELVRVYYNKVTVETI